MALNPLPPLEEKIARVREMFDRIAARYDRMNRLLTVWLEQNWRRTALDTDSSTHLTLTTVLPLSRWFSSLSPLSLSLGI